MVFIVIPYFIDQINGFVNLVLNRDLPISKAYKTPMLLFAIIYTFLFDKTRRYSIMLIILLLLMSASTVVNIYDQYPQFDDLASDLGYMLKIFSFPVLYFFFAVFHTRNPFPEEQFVRKIFLFLFGAFGVAILLSYMGFGIPFYGTTREGESIGQQGYFISGNEISGMYLLYASVFYYYVFKSESIINMFLGLAVGIGVGMLMGSKTAIGSSIICFFGIYFLLKMYRRKIGVINKVDASILVTFTGIMFLGVIFISQISEIIQPVIRHFTYRYNVSGDVVRFLTSGRLERAEGVLNNFINNYSFGHMLFGEGYTMSKTLQIANWRYSNSEMDIIDIMCIAGIFGVTIIYSFWTYIFLKIYQVFRNRSHELAVPLTIAFAILIINSVLSGHIIYSGVVTPNLAYLSVFILKQSHHSRNEG